MVERRSRRKPLVLASTQALLDSLPGERRGPAPPPPESVRLRAGVLRFPARPSGPGCGGEFGDLASFVALPTSALRRLAVVTGTTVLVKNTDNNVGRIVKAVVLDRPSLEESKREHPDSDPVASTSSSDRVMGFLPTRSFPANGFAPLDEDVAYVSPLLAFNLGVHVSCLKLLIQKGEEPFKFCSKVFEDGSAGSGTAIGGSDYQDMIDQALNEHFKFDRFLASGDVFCIHNDWNCGMISCLACNKENDRLHPPSMIYFKVTGMEPSNEPILRVNRDQTALVLGGSASAPIPPCSFFSANDDSVPLHGEVVEQLASIIAPALCPSNILPRIKFSTFLYGPSGCGKRTVVRHVANHLGMHVVECCCHDLMTSSESGASAALVAAFKEAQKYSPSIILLRHFDAIGNTSSNEGPQSEQSGIAANVESVIKQYTGQRWVVKDSLPARDVIGNSYLVEPECVSSVQVILVATADSAEGMQQSIRRCFRHEVNMKTINEDQRKNLISETLHGVSAVADESIDDKFVKDISVQTSGFMPRDILALVADAGVSFAHKVAVEKSSNDELEDAPTASSSTTQKEENHFCKEDILSSLERAKKRNRAALGTPKVPDVKWEDVGGLEEVKKVILDTIQLPLLYKHLFSSKLPKRSGVLLYGPPGTGKTLLAKAVATECSLNFLSVKGPELINMYVGESEKNVRDIFEKLLVEIDGLSDNSQDLFIIGATNRPDLLDSALLRPGRFDKLLYIGVNTEASYRERILKAQTRKYKLNENVSLLSIAQHCPPNFTGADIYALCADAWFHAAKRSVKTLEADPSRNNDAGAEEVIVETEDFMTVLGDISPSLSMEELQNYEQLRQKIEGPSR
ncbi:hypothetical protein CFC21_031691 [Triticum aestivum]|uniref:AAA+ ATPase domain-containing protein n=1 Tax=Triticum aestivum TaxID=4565 RepID=A0A9R1EY96_WHEAT|nr:hypothetical protein CFC21_031691 [Triticum aestivum]